MHVSSCILSEGAGTLEYYLFHDQLTRFEQNWL
jgi:hypothetical protein